LILLFGHCLLKGDGKLAVMICISGWMAQKDDYKRTFGVIPDEDSLELEERLSRFYQQVCGKL
jgi:uncharacterized membrane protein